MKTKRKEESPLIFSNQAQLQENLRKWFGSNFQGTSCCMVCVYESETTLRNFGLESGENEPRATRVLIVFAGLPIDLNAMGLWREWAVGCGAYEICMDYVSDNPEKTDFESVLNKHCDKWFHSCPAPDKPGLELGQWVTMPKGQTAKDDPSLVTMMFGSMGELLTEVDVVARRFSKAISSMAGKDRYLKEIDSLLSRKKLSTRNSADLEIGNITDQLPKLLLLGDSGVGKTLITAYLNERCGLKGRHLHISIPEYIGKEDMFEYTLFGYAAGNYTGGRPDGDHGLLLERIGGVVFLDEIGEANAAIQAKLLTFLDHYHIRPRGWVGDPFYCPILVVAATNRDLEEKESGKPLFRRDLLARFTDVHTIPPLRERKQDFAFILDCLLQRESMNPDQAIKEIGQEAMQFLIEHDFRKGNFRELEDMFRRACKIALREKRHFLVRSDFE